MQNGNCYNWLYRDYYKGSISWFLASQRCLALNVEGLGLRLWDLGLWDFGVMG